MDGNINSFNELIEIINTLNTDDEIADFVKKRIEILENNSQKRIISNNNDGKLIGTINEGYITSNSPIVSSLMVDPFYLNDNTIYVDFLKQLKGKQFANILSIFYELRDFTQIKFGFKGNQSNRESIYLQERDDKISIADFYNNNSALCSERSAVVQNIAEFCCIKSFLVFGKMEVEGKVEDHAYNIFKTRDETLILFDSTNPVALDYDGTARYAPAYSIIGKEDINNIEEINFDFNLITQMHKTPIYKDEKNRIYRTYNYVLNHQNSSSKNI